MRHRADAVSVIATDQLISETVLQELLKNPAVKRARTVEFQHAAEKVRVNVLRAGLRHLLKSRTIAIDIIASVAIIECVESPARPESLLPLPPANFTF